MAYIIRNNVKYAGGSSSSSGDNAIECTMAEYEAFEAQGKVIPNTTYYITDYTENENISLDASNVVFDDTDTQMGVDTVQGAIEKLNTNIDEQNKKKVDFFTLQSSESVTTSEKTFSTLNGRKFSDYQLINILLLVGGYYRSSILVPITLFKGFPSIISYVDGANVQRHVTVTYVDDTTYKAVSSSNLTSCTLTISGLA